MRRVPTLSDREATAARLRAARAAVVAVGPPGRAFAQAWADAVDVAVRELAGAVELPGCWAVVAHGSYARRELCPGSDIDIALVHDGVAASDAAAAAEQLWYPLWDAGLVLGHAVRTPGESLEVAATEPDVLTALLDTRLVAGDEGLIEGIVARVRALAARRANSIVGVLADAADARRERPGPIAEMIEPNVKDGAGGLRDVQALAWAGWTRGGPGDVGALVECGFLRPDDSATLAAARARLLETRIALQRSTKGRSDVLTLEDQDAVARMLDMGDADRLMQDLAMHARRVTWIADDVWRRLRAAGRGPIGRLARRDRLVAPEVVLRDCEVTLTANSTVDALTTLNAAVAAAQRERPINRASLERMRGLEPVIWTDPMRKRFVALLATGRRAIAVLEALDQVGVVEALLPEWAHVRARPQRNPYHRHTVDRHLLETAATEAELLAEPGFDGDVARRASSEVLLLAALLHDIGKGVPGDHSHAGAEVAGRTARRIGLEERATEQLAWLVRNHLALASTATRRDVGDPDTVRAFAEDVGDGDRLDLLYALTIADGRATGPAAWGTAKATLARELFMNTDMLLRARVEPVVDARPAVLDANYELLADRRLQVVWHDLPDGGLECIVAAPDQQGLLANVAGVLALYGFDIRSASAYEDASMALEVFRGTDRYGRLTPDRRDGFEAEVDAALAGRLALRDRLAERVQRYSTTIATASDVNVSSDIETSGSATIIEVHTRDDVALLARLAAVLASHDLDVSTALASTTADRAVEVFYVRDTNGAKITDLAILGKLRGAIVREVTKAPVS